MNTCCFCRMAGNVTIREAATGREVQICRTHAEPYAENTARFEVTSGAEHLIKRTEVVACGRCGRPTGHKGRAAHTCRDRDGNAF